MIKLSIKAISNIIAALGSLGILSLIYLAFYNVNVTPSAAVKQISGKVLMHMYSASSALNKQSSEKTGVKHKEPKESKPAPTQDNKVKEEAKEVKETKKPSRIEDTSDIKAPLVKEVKKEVSAKAPARKVLRKEVVKVKKEVTEVTKVSNKATKRKSALENTITKANAQPQPRAQEGSNVSTQKTQATSTTFTQEEKVNYLGILLNMVDDIKEYPRRARRLGIEGKCTISVEINPTGVITKGTLTSSCGHRFLDKGAQDLIDELVGKSLGVKLKDKLKVNLPINYRLM